MVTFSLIEVKLKLKAESTLNSVNAPCFIVLFFFFLCLSFLVIQFIFEEEEVAKIFVFGKHRCGW